MSLWKWIIIVLFILLFLVLLPFSFTELRHNQESFTAFMEQRQNDCDTCLSSFDVTCGDGGRSGECVGRYIDANAACAKNCTINLI